MDYSIQINSVLARGRVGTLNAQASKSFRDTKSSLARTSVLLRAVGGLCPSCFVPPLLRNQEWCNFTEPEPRSHRRSRLCRTAGEGMASGINYRLKVAVEQRRRTYGADCENSPAYAEVNHWARLRKMQTVDGSIRMSANAVKTVKSLTVLLRPELTTEFPSKQTINHNT